MAAEPTTAEAVRWLASTGRSQSECIDELWGPLPPDQRRKVEGRLRQAVFKARRCGEARVAAPLNGPSPATAAPPSPVAQAVRAVTRDPDPGDDADATGLDRIPYLRRQLQQIERLIDGVVRNDQVRFFAALDARREAVREELDLALERERKIVRLERTPGAICAELAKRGEAVALRAELQRRRAVKVEQQQEVTDR